MADNKKYEKPVTHKVNLTHDGEIIGEGEITEDGRIWEGKLTAEGARKVFPKYDPTKGLSIGIKERQSNAYGATPWDPKWEETLRNSEEKGTFDA